VLTLVLVLIRNPDKTTTETTDVNTIPLVNSSKIENDNGTEGGGRIMDTVADRTAEADAVFGNNAGDVSTLLWGRGIYDAHDTHGHQFWHERESW